MEVIRNPISFSISNKFRVKKNCIIALFLIASIGTGKVISSYWEFQDISFPFSLCSSLSHSNSLNILIQDKYLSIENDDLLADAPKKFNSQISTFNPGILNPHPVGPQYVNLFDRINSSPYPSFFASLPLRSPPVFS